MPVWLLRYLPYLLGVLALIGGLWAIHHHGYKAGQAERTAYYQPILAKIDLERVKAEARVKTIQASLDALPEETEKRHADAEKALRERADAAVRRNTDLVRLISRGDRCPVSEAAGHSAEPAGTSAVPDGLGRIGEDLTTLARRAVSDAQGLAACEQFLRDERNLLAH